MQPPGLTPDKVRVVVALAGFHESMVRHTGTITLHYTDGRITQVVRVAEEITQRFVLPAS